MCNRRRHANPVSPLLASSVASAGALIRFGGGVAEMRGSIGGTTFARNRGGAYARNRTTPLNPASVRQSAVRATLADLSAAWSNALTASERAAWELYAANVPLLNSLGEARQVSGVNMYVRTNQLVLDCGGSRIDAAPTIFTVGPTISPTYVLDEAADELDITDLGGFTIPAEGTYLFIAQGTPQNAGVNFFRSPFRKIRGELLATGHVFPDTGTPLAFPIAAGQADFIRTIAITADGRVGGESVQRFLVS